MAFIQPVKSSSLNTSIWAVLNIPHFNLNTFTFNLNTCLWTCFKTTHFHCSYSSYSVALIDQSASFQLKLDLEITDTPAPGCLILRSLSPHDHHLPHPPNNHWQWNLGRSKSFRQSSPCGAGPRRASCTIASQHNMQFSSKRGVSL